MKPIRGLPFLAARLFGVPLAVEPGKLEVILAAIGPRVLGVGAEEFIVDLSADPQVKALLPGQGTKQGPESLTQVMDGVAVVDVTGTLVHRSSWMDAMSGLCSYERISAELDQAAANPNVHAILLNLNSPGGEVSGMFEMADRIASLRGKGKPIYAIAADCACSAAYFLGAACEKFYATEGAITGSIGIVFAHLDSSEADKMAGIKVTHIHAGTRKVDGNRHEPLSDAAKSTLQQHVDQTAAVMFGRVDKYRGLALGSAQATEAAVYVGAAAEGFKIIDGIRSTRAVLAELRSKRGSTPQSQFNGGSTATKPKEKQMELGQALAALAAVTMERDALRIDLTEARAQIAVAIEAQRADIIEKHVRAGRVTPAVRADVTDMAKSMAPEELDARLAKWPTHLRPVATGKIDANPGTEGVDPLALLNSKAKEIQAGKPGTTFPDAFADACKQNPALYKEYREATALATTSQRTEKKGRS